MADDNAPVGELLSDGDGGYFTRVWECEAPEPDVRFIVVRAEWNADFTVQTVQEVWIP